MDKKSRYVILTVMLVVPLFLIVYHGPEKEIPPTGDSGFDSSYDSGGGGGGSSSSWDSSSGSGGSNGPSVAEEESVIYKKYFDDGITFDSYWRFFKSGDHIKMFLMELFFHSFLTFCIYVLSGKPSWMKKYYIIVAVILLFVPSVYIFLVEFLGSFIYVFSKNKKEKVVNNIDPNINYVEIDLTPYGIDPDTIHQEIYDIYVRIQEAWMNYRLDDVRDCLSDELYNQYAVQLDTLIAKNERNVMKDFKYLMCAITNIEEKDGTQILTVTLRVKCRDYIINDQSKKVLRGNKNKILTYTYELHFERSKETTVTTCPNCGSKLDPKGNGVTCDYCHAKIVRKSSNLVLRKKEMLHQN